MSFSYVTTAIFDSFVDEKISKAVLTEQSETPLPTINPPAPLLSLPPPDQLDGLGADFPFSKIKDIFVLPFAKYSALYNIPASEVPFLNHHTFFQRRCNILFVRKTALEDVFLGIRRGLRRFLKAGDAAVVQLVLPAIRALLHNVETVRAELATYFSTNLLSANELVVYRVVMQLTGVYTHQLRIYETECTTFLAYNVVTYPVEVLLTDVPETLPILKGRSVAVKVLVISGSLLHLPTLKVSLPTPIVFVGGHAVDGGQFVETQATEMQQHAICGGTPVYSVVTIAFTRGSNKDVLQLRFVVTVAIPKDDGTTVNTTFLSEATTTVIVLTNMSQWFVAQRRLHGDALFNSHALFSVPLDKYFNSLNLISVASTETTTKLRLPFVDYTRALYVVGTYLPSCGCPLLAFVDAERFTFLSKVFLRFFDLLLHNRALFVLYSSGCLFSFIAQQDVAALLTHAQLKLPEGCIVVVLVFDISFGEGLSIGYLVEQHPTFVGIQTFRKATLAGVLNGIAKNTSKLVVLLQSNQQCPPFTEASAFSFVDLDDLLNDNFAD